MLQTVTKPQTSATTDSTAIKCQAVRKDYGRVLALDGVSLRLPLGGSLGLLGENGAGKSSLIRLLLGFTFPTSGTIHLFDSDDPGAARQRIGYLPEQPQYDRNFTALEYLTYLGRLDGTPRPALTARIRELLTLVGLGQAADRRIGGYSKGMQQRVGIAAALLNRPDLLIVDEPTSGLDPAGQYEVRQLLLRLREAGLTLLLASHQLAEVEALCDEVAILRRGKVVVGGAVRELLAVGAQVEIEVAGMNGAAMTAVRSACPDAEIAPQRLLVPQASRQPVLHILLNNEVQVVSVNPVRRTLEELYLQVSRDGRPASRPYDDRQDGRAAQ